MKRTQEGQISRKGSWVRFPVRAVPVAQKLSTIEERRQDQSYLFRRGDYRNKDHNPPKKLSWVPFPVKTVSVARKLSTIEELRQDQSCLFRRGCYRNKDHASQKTVLSSIPGEDGFCSSETKHDRRTVPRQKLFVSARRLQKQRPQPRKTVLCWSSDDDVGFRDNFSPMRFNYAYRIIRPMISFRATKLDKKCKHLSNLPVVILRALC
jgi:hypothetical protein